MAFAKIALTASAISGPIPAEEKRQKKGIRVSDATRWRGKEQEAELTVSRDEGDSVVSLGEREENEADGQQRLHKSSL